MSRNLHLGAASISFSQPLYIESTASIVSQKEADGPLGDFFDLICKDPMFGCGTWESAESTLQKETATLAMNKAGLDFEDIHLMFAGKQLSLIKSICRNCIGHILSCLNRKKKSTELFSEIMRKKKTTGNVPYRN